MLTVVALIAIAGGVGLFEQGWPSGPVAGGSTEPPAGAAMRVPSDTCSWDALCIPYVEDPASRAVLDLGDGWSRAWSAEWRINGAELVCSVRDLASVPVSRAAPVRHFSFATRQRHRPGLEYVASTGAMHGFESMEEQRVLLALDFAAQVVGVLSQPFRLTYRAAGRMLRHTPDLLAVTASGCWVIDVRPAARIEAEDRIAFSAVAEAALAVGWRYRVVVGWLPQVCTTLEDLSQRRRDPGDRFSLRPALMGSAARGPIAFGDLATSTELPAVARAQAIYLLWHRRLGMDLAEPLTDHAVIWSAAR
jgi:hypothetical protein